MTRFDGLRRTRPRALSKEKYYEYERAANLSEADVLLHEGNLPSGRPRRQVRSAFFSWDPGLAPGAHRARMLPRILR